MPESFATVAQFEARHGDVATADEPQVTELLKDASALIRSHISGSTATWIPEASIVAVPRAVVAAAVAAAYRAWTNPDAVSREGEADVSVSYATDTPDAVYLTKRERRAVRRAAGLGGSASITLETPYSGDATQV